MRSLTLTLAFTFGLMCASEALAQESLDDLEPNTSASAESDSVSARPTQEAHTSKHSAEINGYLVHRESYSQVHPVPATDTRDVPSLTQLVEANVQARVPLGSPKHFAYADLSMIYQRGGLYYVNDGAGGRATYPDHDVAALRPAFVPSELYLSLSPKPYFNLLAGKKRITWGSGFAYNPTDLINPPKDPTDPNFQRAGNWLLRIEAPFEHFTLTALAAPQALYNSAGLPYALLRYPSHAPASGPDTRDERTHYLLAGRVYLLAADTDINFIYYFSNYYQDDFSRKSRLGVSFARYFWTDYELHAEALVTRGSPRSFPNHDCAALGVGCDVQPAFAATKLDASRIYPRIIVGTRRQFANEALVSLEYYYQGDGYTPTEFSDAVTLMVRSQATRANPATSSDASMNAAGLPQRYSFNTLRRNYLIASYSQPRISDDWTLGMVVIAGLDDWSGLVSPSVAWSSMEWLTLSLFGYLPFHATGSHQAKVAGHNYGEYSLMPVDFRVMFEARAYY
jgi:hypothetical protein